MILLFIFVWALLSFHPVIAALLVVRWIIHYDHDRKAA